MALATTGLGIGGIFFRPITPVLIDAGSWRTIWVVMAVAFMALSIPLSAIFLRRQPEDIGLEVDGRPGVPVEPRVTGQATGSVPEECRGPSGKRSGLPPCENCFWPLPRPG